MVGPNTVVESANRHRKFLNEHIDPDSGLLDELLANETLIYEEILEIKTKKTFIRRNSRLLDYIVEKNELERLLTVLVDTKQKHIVNYLNSDGVYNDEEDWPLLDSQRKILRVNQTCLVDLIDADELVSHLYSRGVINKRQRNLIASKGTSEDKNEALLDILRRRSIRDYNTTIQCLNVTKQSHIAEILVKSGVVLGLHVNLDDATGNTNQTENELCSTIANLLRDRSPDEARIILEQAHIKVIAAKTGGSIILYFLCTTMKELQLLEDSLSSDNLKNSLEELFTRLLSRSQRILVSNIILTKEEYERKRLYLEDCEIQPDKSQNQKLQSHLFDKMAKIPLEILDIILQKTYLFRTIREDQSHPSKDEEIIIAISSVDNCWSQRIKKRKLKNTIWRQLSVFYTKKKKVPTATLR